MTRRSAILHVAIVAVLSILVASRASAIVIDGILDPAYTPLAVQTTQTSLPDANTGTIDFANGSELDGAYAAVDGGSLYLFFAGNLRDMINPIEAGTILDPLEIFLDTGAGGQNTLLPGAPLSLAGLTFDADFAPDYQFQLNAGGAIDHQYRLDASEVTLSAGGDVATFLGTSAPAGGPGVFAGGSNPFGIRATSDNRNTLGVASGCAAATGAGVTTGIEMAIPLAAIGNPTGCIRGCAFVYGYFQNNNVSNQVLPPVPPGTCSLGPPSSVNFAAIPGSQTFLFCPSPVAVRKTTWGQLRNHYR